MSLFPPYLSGKNHKKMHISNPLPFFLTSEIRNVTTTGGNICYLNCKYLSGQSLISIKPIYWSAVFYHYNLYRLSDSSQTAYIWENNFKYYSNLINH